MPVFEVVSRGDRRSLMKRFERKSKQQAISELVDFHLLNCDRIEKLEAERDAALARVAELERQEPAGWLAYHFGGKRHGTVYGGPCGTKEEIERYIQQVERSDDSITLQGKPFYAAPVAQAQHSVPEGWKPVPIEPTPEMLDARRDCEDGMDGYLVEDTEYYFPGRDAVRAFLARVYRGLIAAAPAPGGER
ncbi:TPA: hypothetical protein ACF3OS_004001 [Pseudomonas aeruginosa]